MIPLTKIQVNSALDEKEGKFLACERLGVVLMDVGITERIAELRILKGMSYAQFGAEIGRSKTAIYYAETGERNATPDLLRRISNVFCVNEEWLLKGTGEIFDDAAIKKKKIYDIAFSKLEKVADSCKQLEGSLYFGKRHSFKIDT